MHQNKKLWPIIAASLLIGVGLLSPSSADAHVKQSRRPMSQKLVPVKKDPLPTEKASKPRVPGKDDKDAGKDDGLRGQLEFKEFSRSPGIVLQSLAEQAATNVEATNKKSADILQAYILQGNWPLLKQTLAQQSAERGSSLYRQILAGLAQRRGEVTLLPDDVLAVADAAPVPLTADDCALLGVVLGKSLDQVRGPEHLLRRLETGTIRLGGQDRAKRLCAGQMLLAAGLASEASAFYPPLREVLASNDAEVLNQVALCQKRIAEKLSRPEPLAVAWVLTQKVLSLPKATRPQRFQALARSLELLPMRGEQAGDWIDEQLGTDDARAMQALSAIGGESGASSNDVGARLLALSMVKQFGERLALQQDKPSRKLPLSMLTLLWASQATMALSPSGDGSQQNDSSGERVYVQSRPMGRYGRMHHPQILDDRISEQQQNNNRPQSLPPLALLELSPSDTWSRALPPDLRGRVLRCKGALAAQGVDVHRALAIAKQLAADKDDAAAEIVCALVTNWANDTSSDEQASNSNLLRSPFPGSNWMSSSGGGGNSNGSIPLTRARQVRRLRNLVNLIAEIRASGVPSDYSGELVQAFVSCHSPAEVYRNADIEAVFGPVSDHSAKVSSLLAERMRSSLSGQWQRMEIQTQNNTNRTPEDQIAEIRRGYALALELLDRALKRNPEDADLHLALAATTFDQAEFLHGQMVDLKTYVALRDKAFKHYADTAALYAASPAPTTPGQQRADIYARWFSAALGASDLSSLLPSDTPHADQIDQIAAALRGLGGEAASAHIKQFAEAFLQSSREVPAQLKPFCCRQVLRVVRDHPAGDPIRKLLRTYDELIAEVEFSAELDGAAEVGTNHPFGVRLAIRATSNMQREANGFIQVLAGNQGNSLDPKEKIKSMLKEQVADRFDIDVVQFHDPTTAPRSFGRQGWLEKPVAYLVLRAKNPAVDRLPPLHVDLEFGDGSGTVLLPIASSPLLVAAAKGPKVGELSAVKLRQIFDDRTARDGSWQVEVKATATGLVTDLDQVLAIKPDVISGAKVSKIDRGAISVSGFDLTGKQIRPISQRTWTIYLAPKGEAATTPFQFPAAAVAGSEMKYQRYEDFDVVDAGATVTARTGRDGAGWLHGGALWATLGGFVVVLAGLLVWLKRRSKPSAPPVAAYRRPAAPSPFNVLDLLRRIRTDASLKLSEDERSALDQAVIQLETRYFSRPNGDGGDLPLGETLNRWLARATSNGH